MEKRFVVPQEVATLLVTKTFETRASNMAAIMANVDGVPTAIGIIKNNKEETIIMVLNEFKDSIFIKVGHLDGIDVFTIKQA